MRIFADLHHSDLYYSLQLLFEKRLGFEMYRPIGLDWWEQGFWHVYNHPATAAQYLGLDQAINTPKDHAGNPFPEAQLLNKNYIFEDGIYYVNDPSHKKIQRAITLDKFKDMRFDILISSMPVHIQPFNNLIQLYQPQAKHIFQVGNAWGHQGGVKNILSSTAPFGVPGDVNACFYHQEFDLDVFKYTSPNEHKLAHSYIHYMQELDLLNSYKAMLPDWIFNTYGAGMDDVVNGTDNMAKSMTSSGWTWHVKPGGDGFGHVLFNSYACGRPAIIKSNYYMGKLASELLEDGVTCIDISKRPIHENAAILMDFSDPEKHTKMCEAAYNRFCTIVNYDEEERQIRNFLERLV